MIVMTSFKARVTAMGWKFTQRDRDENVKLRTHNLMDGGELSVPASENEAFLRVCAECICDGERLYVVEQRSHPGYNLFFDLDVHLHAVVKSDEWWVKVCRLIVATLNELFDESLEGFEIVCSVADAKQVRKNQRECYKYGIHVTSCSIVVDKEKMLRIRAALVQKLQNNLEKDGPTSWEDDVDSAVYESSGFRMLFSRKGGRCKCTQKQRDMCERCEGTGKLDEGRPYRPLLTMDSRYSIVTHPAATDPPAFDSVYAMLRRTSIRTVRAPTAKFNRSPPSWFEDSSLFEPPAGLIAAPKRRRLSEGVEVVESKLDNVLELSSADLRSFNAWFQLMCQKKQLPRQYRGVDVTRAFSFTTNNVRSNVIARVDSQHCMNIGREHATNTVYMLVNTLTKKATMKCYCRCDTTEGRRAMVKGKVQMCKDFSSASIDASGLDLGISCGVTARAIKPRILAMF